MDQERVTNKGKEIEKGEKSNRKGNTKYKNPN